MESQLGQGNSFGDVRVHADSQEAGSAHAVAKGEDLHFAKDKYQPGTKEGNWLIAHELTHVVQQRKGGSGAAHQPYKPDDPVGRGELENEADQAASTVMEGGHADIEMGAEPGGEQKSEGGQTAVQSGTTSAGKLDNQSYAHGGFYGAAGEMLKDPLWCNILQALMPDAYAKVKDESKVSEAMRQMENNPVMAAYGASKNLASEGEKQEDTRPDEKHQTVPIEWDVWLDKDKPDDLSKVKIAHGQEMATVLGQIPGIRGLVPSMAPSVKAGLPAMGGGDSNWVEIFGKAISMYRAGGKMPADAKDKPPDEQQELLKKLAHVEDAPNMIATAKEFLSKQNGGGVVLDVKSTYSSPGDVAAFVAKLKAEGIDVRMVGSFRHEQLGELDQKETRGVTFVHSIDGLEAQVKDETLKPGDHVMFNAADLLKKDDSGGEDSWKENPDSLNRIAALVEKAGLRIGLYVQETAAGPRAVRMVTKICNEHPNLFADGFAHGDVNGQTESETTGSGMGKQATPAMLEKAKNKGVGAALGDIGKPR
jgi:hypothetical protein